MLQFVDVTDKPELAIGPEDDSQPIMDSKDKKTRKWLEHVTKKKARRNNLYAFMWQVLATSSATPLLSRSLMLALSSCPGSPTPLLACPLGSLTPLSYFFVPTLLFRPAMPALLFHPPIPTLFSPHLMPTLLFSLPVPALLSPLGPVSLSHFVLGPTPTRLIFSALRTFK